MLGDILCWLAPTRRRRARSIRRTPHAVPSAVEYVSHHRSIALRYLERTRLVALRCSSKRTYGEYRFGVKKPRLARSASRPRLRVHLNLTFVVQRILHLSYRSQLRQREIVGRKVFPPLPPPETVGESFSTCRRSLEIAGKNFSTCRRSPEIVGESSFPRRRGPKPWGKSLPPGVAAPKSWGKAVSPAAAG